MTQTKENSKFRIHSIGETSETLVDRGGLILFTRYIEQIGVIQRLGEKFSRLRKSRKGLPIEALFKQILAFLADGTSFSLVRFDELKRDRGWKAVVELPFRWLASSHAVKRFFSSFKLYAMGWFRSILLELFIWRLKVEKPEVVVIGMDVVVLDNNEAKEREGVEMTYRKVRGFAPLVVTWGPYIIDVVFRGGRKHGNHGETVRRVMEEVVEKIRRRYRADVPIVWVMDAGFFDQENMEGWDELGVGYIVGGRIYGDMREYLSGLEEEAWGVMEKGGDRWEWVEFGDRRGVWDRFRRAVYWRYDAEGGQGYLEFARPDRVVYTNLGVHKEVTEGFCRAGYGHWLQGEAIIRLYHGRGRDELVHRGLKDFGTERLPMKRFLGNMAYFYCQVIAFTLFEAFKRDVLEGRVGVRAYATTVRRVVFDIAAKVVWSGRRVVLKVAKEAYRRLKVDKLWEAVHRAPPIGVG